MSRIKDFEGATDEQIEQAVAFLNAGIAYDYCSDWGVTGVIMQNEEISCTRDDNIQGWLAMGTPKHFDHGDLTIVSDWGANPLRCICIVYLQMQYALEDFEKQLKEQE
jgi:hypothetical protein